MQIIEIVQDLIDPFNDLNTLIGYEESAYSVFSTIKTTLSIINEGCQFIPGVDVFCNALNTAFTVVGDVWKFLHEDFVTLSTLIDDILNPLNFFEGFIGNSNTVLSTIQSDLQNVVHIMIQAYNVHPR